MAPFVKKIKHINIYFYIILDNPVFSTNETDSYMYDITSGEPEFNPDFEWCSCNWIFCNQCCELSTIVLHFAFWPLYCLTFDLRLLITPVVIVLDIVEIGFKHLQSLTVIQNSLYFRVLNHLFSTRNVQTNHCSRDWSNSVKEWICLSCLSCLRKQI